MAASDTKHLRKRHNVWSIHYRLPKRLKDLPEFTDHPPFYSKSLETDSITTAKRLRDRIINNLHKTADDSNSDWESKIIQDSEQFATDNPHINDRDLYHSLQIEKVVDEAARLSGVNPATGYPNEFNAQQQDKLDILQGKKPAKEKMLRFINKKVIKEKEAMGRASSTTLKIRRSADWLLENMQQTDADITTIDYDLVHEFLVLSQNEGVAGKTLNGFLGGLGQTWERAKRSKVVSGDNPFRDHRIPNNSVSYDHFTADEIQQLYTSADDKLKVLIHAAATTGSRLGELMTAEVQTPSTVDFKCWLFKFKDKGKTELSTRVVPLHSTLDLPNGFTFDYSDRTASRDFRNHMDSVLGEPLDELTGKPRKLSFHSFRSTVVTELTVNHSINEKVTGSITGHSGGDSGKVGSIRTYIQPKDLQKKRELVDLLIWNCS